jgi:type VI protein secretion system component VasA
VNTKVDKATRLLQRIAREHDRQAAEADRRRDARIVELLAPDRFATVPPVAAAVVERPPASGVLERNALVVIDVHGDEVDFRVARRTPLVGAEIEEGRVFGPGGTRPTNLPSGATGLHLVARYDAPDDRAASDHPLRLYIHVNDDAGASIATRLAYDLSEPGGARVLARAVGSTAWHSVHAVLSGPSHARGVLPRPRLGCPARGLAALWFAAPEVFPRVDLHGLDRVPRDGRVELAWLVRDPTALRSIGADPASVIRLDVAMLVNRVLRSEPVALDAAQPDAPLPLPEGLTLLKIRKVRRVAEDGGWHECPPWLGARHPGPCPAGVYRPQYVAAVDRAPAGGREVVRLGLVDARPPSARRAITHLNAALALAHRDLPRDLAGRAGRGDGGLAVRLLCEPSPCLVAPPAAADDLAAEALAAAPLAGQGDVTERLALWLERAAAAVPADGPARGRVARHVAGLRRAAVEAGAPIDGVPGIDVTVDLDVSCYDGAPALFVALLDQVAADLAPPMAYARLTARFDRETSLTCPPRLCGGTILGRPR